MIFMVCVPLNSTVETLFCLCIIHFPVYPYCLVSRCSCTSIITYKVCILYIHSVVTAVAYDVGSNCVFVLYDNIFIFTGSYY